MPSGATVRIGRADLFNGQVADEVTQRARGLGRKGLTDSGLVLLQRQAAKGERLAEPGGSTFDNDNVITTLWGSRHDTPAGATGQP
jgi:hypothetical protein